MLAVDCIQHMEEKHSSWEQQSMQVDSIWEKRKREGLTLNLAATNS